MVDDAPARERALTSTGKPAFTFIAPASFLHSKTRAHVRLLGPCFKTGRMRPFDRQRPGRIVRSHRPSDRQQSRRTARSPPLSTTDRRDGTLASPEGRHAPRHLGRPRAMRRRPITTAGRSQQPTLPSPLRPRANRRWRAPARSATVPAPNRTAAVYSDPQTARPTPTPAESRAAHC